MWVKTAPWWALALSSDPQAWHPELFLGPPSKTNPGPGARMDTVLGTGLALMWVRGRRTRERIEGVASQIPPEADSKIEMSKQEVSWGPF